MLTLLTEYQTNFILITSKGIIKFPIILCIFNPRNTESRQPHVISNTLRFQNLSILMIANELI